MKNSVNKVVVFGATGTVGAYAIIELLQYGFDVIAVGRRKSDNGFFSDMGVPYYSMDISCVDDFSQLPQEGIYAIVHLAGIIPARMRGYFPQQYIDSVLTGTLNVLNYCVKVMADRIIFAQSVSDVIHLYGTKEPIDPDSPMKFPLNNDHSVYSICKNAAVNLIEHYYAKYGIKRFNLRFPNIYLYHPNPYYYVDGVEKWQSYRYLINRAIQGLPLELWGDPNKVRDIVYVKDCTQIIRKAIVANVEGGMYNVGTGVGTSMREQIEGIVEIFSPKNKSSVIIDCPDKPDSPEYIMDINKTKFELGYSPQYDYISYLKDMKLEMNNQTFERLWGKSM